jgi:hypothetical protein
MQIQYTARRADVGALFMYNLRHSPQLWRLLVGLALFPSAMNAAILAASRRPMTGADIGFPLLVGALAATALPIFARLRTKRDERVLSVEADGIRTSIGKLSGHVPWKGIAAVDVTPEYVFITGKSGNGFAIPARAFATPQEREEFLRAIARFRRPDP